MALRWLHKGWKGFWKIIFSLLVVLVVLGGGVLALLQFDATKDVIVEKIENDFRKNYNGRLTLGDLDGFLPFNAELTNVVLTSPSDSGTADTLARIGSARIGVDIWALFQNKLSINAFTLQQPSVRLLAVDSGSYTLAKALKKKKDQKPINISPNEITSSWIKNIEIIAPQVRVKSGTLFIEQFYNVSKNIDLPQPLKITGIDASMFVELTESERFVEMKKITAQAQQIRAGDIEVSGQLYNDNQFFEFNAFHLRLGTSHIHLNGSIDGVDLYKGHLRDQLSSAQYDIEVSSHRLQLSEFTDVLTQLPDIKKPFDFTLQTKGNIDELELGTFRVGVGESYFSIAGRVDHLFNSSQLTYNFNIDTLSVRKQDVEILTGPLNANQYRALEDLRLNGRANGSSDSLVVDVSGSSSLGSFVLDGEGQLKSPYGYQGQLSGQGINIGPLVAAGIDTTNLNFNANISGRNTSLTTGRINFEAKAQNSVINDIYIDSLRLTTSLQQGTMEAQYYYRNQEQRISGEGSANFNDKDPSITLNGTTRNVNLPGLFANITIDSSSFNANYTIEMKGTEPDRIQGIAQFEVDESVINGDSIGAHQFRVQLDSPDLATRTFQVNSSLFDLNISGDLKPSNISHQATYWANYFKERIAREIRFDSTDYVPKKRAPYVNPLELKGSFKAKDLALVKRYWSDFPSVVTNSTANFQLYADSSDLEFSSQIQSDTLSINTVQIRDAGSQLSGRFNHNQTLKDYASLNVETQAERFESNMVEMDSLSINLDYKQDSLYYSQEVQRFSKDARFNLKMHSKLSDKEINVAIDDFFLGDDEYAWETESTAKISFNRAKVINFDSFRFINKNEFFALQGKLSPDSNDSLQTIIRDVNLERISELLKGKFNFAGRLNGSLQTSSLSETPSVQGNLTINRLQIQDRLVGDIDFSSQYIESKKRFDARLQVITDSTKYQQYIEANEDIGQNIVLDGYFVPSDMDTEQDTAFYFDANFNEIDMWVVQLVTQNIFTQLEGSASGSGYIFGNLQDLNFSADFQANDVYAKPAFLLTNYYLDGHIKFNSKEGVVLDKVDIRDNQGGTGMISGSVDLNDFEPISFINLQMKLNDLRFLNNDYNADVPFYGKVAGSGNISLSGSNTDLQLRSTKDIQVSENSVLSIPLMESTNLSSSNSFIRFVESFDDPKVQKIGLSEQNVRNLKVDKNVLEQALDNLTFNERFNIDLQFDAPDPIDMRLVFDRVTGERMSAEGTGRLRIAMEEGNLQIFGNFDVSGGSYQFVSGDIFSRELDIRPGGSILWKGPADNAELNIEAVYHARPSVESLTGGESGGANAASRRAPVDLIVEISGTLNSIENSYHFELPSSFDLTSNSTLQFTINRINNDEQTKLLQATSLLLTGSFLATTGARSQESQLSESLTRGSTFINPLLSNQLISPLLSKQMNSLLNSDVSQFDVDFQLNQYNEIDLGIALRLYNDKLILRREGYITGGNQNSGFGERIGDLSATYRINPNLSLTAFHRQDQSFGTVARSNQTNDYAETVDGVGVEAQVQFNTWQQLRYKVQNFFRRLVGKEEIDFKERERQAEENEKNITENKN